MAKRRSALGDHAVYLAVRLFVCAVQAMTWDLAMSLARGMAWVFRTVDRRHRQVVLDNLRSAFPDLDKAALDRLLRDSYDHLLISMIEFAKAPRVLHPRSLERYIRYADPNSPERIRLLHSDGRPNIVVTGHFGNWEVMGYAAGMIHMRGAIVARRLDNPLVDGYLAKLRKKTGHVLLDKSADYAQILETIATGNHLIMVGDQDAGPRGLFVEFLGRPASTFKSIALLSLEYQAPIVVIGAARVGTPLEYVVYIEDIILPEDYAQDADAPRSITERHVKALEAMVRRHPEQYFWVHRRWKSQPAARRTKKAA
jgi:Kdo2-lipid IVA lauroyltransferase/acyltransferase